MGIDINNDPLLNGAALFFWRRLRSSGSELTSLSWGRSAVLGSCYFLPSGWSFPTPGCGRGTTQGGLWFLLSPRLCSRFWSSSSLAPVCTVRWVCGTTGDLCRLPGSDSLEGERYVAEGEVAGGVSGVLVFVGGIVNAAHISTNKINITFFDMWSTTYYYLKYYAFSFQNWQIWVNNGKNDNFLIRFKWIFIIESLNERG